MDGIRLSKIAYLTQLNLMLSSSIMMIMKGIGMVKESGMSIWVWSSSEQK